MSFEIALIPENNLPNVRVVPMENKPLLAIAMENPRISQYPVEQRNTNTFNFLTWALDMLGVNNKEGGQGHHKAVHEYVNLKLKGYTYQELKQAILMYVAGEFNNDKLYTTQQFNAVVLGKVMAAYDEHKKQALNKYMRIRSEQKAEEERKNQELTPEQKMNLTKQGLENCYNAYIKTQSIIEGYAWVYDYIVSKEVLTNTKEEKNQAIKEAKEILLKRLSSKTMSRDTYKNFKADIEKKDSNKVIVEAKNILLKQYFDYLLVRFDNTAVNELIKIVSK